MSCPFTPCIWRAIQTAAQYAWQPQHAAARVAYAVCVAVTAFLWQYTLFKPQGLIVALFVWSWTVPLWNRAFAAVRFEWRA